jgi:putative tricarboxylic transport membrane protein
MEAAHWDLLYQGFINSITFANLMACFIGCLIGTIVGVLPGLGPTATMALMLPFTLKFGPAMGLIMMCGVFFGAQYGGSTTSILVNIPGEATSIITCIDGYQMAKKGRAGAALCMVAIGSFIAGSVGILGIQFFAPLLGRAALGLGAPEYLFLMILAFVILSNMSGDDPILGFLMIGLGLFIGVIGVSPLDSLPRFTFGIDNLMQGIEFLPIAMGFFGISEVLMVAMKPYVAPEVKKIRFRNLYPTKDEAKRSIGPIGRGSLLGFFVGLLPGPSAVLATFMSYSIEKSLSRHPEEFGKGMIEGVAGPESANNSGVMGAMIPLLTLGIPFNGPCAMLLAGLRMHNVEPGPLLFTQYPEIFWTALAAFYIGNVMLLILNLPLVGFFARISILRPAVLMPFIMVICLLGVYSVRNALFDVWLLIICGIVGFFFRRWKLPIAPFILGVILGPMTEISLRQTFLLFRGDITGVFGRPVAMGFIITTIAFIIIKTVVPALRQVIKEEKE